MNQGRPKSNLLPSRCDKTYIRCIHKLYCLLITGIEVSISQNTLFSTKPVFEGDF